MPQGAADFSNIQPSGSFPVISDLSSHAIELGSTKIFDRLGKQYWKETFSNGLSRWHIDSGLGADTIEFTPLTSLLQNGAMVADIKTTGNQSVIMQTRIPMVNSDTFGIEVIFWSKNPFVRLNVRGKFGQIVRYGELEFIYDYKLQKFEIVGNTNNVIDLLPLVIIHDVNLPRWYSVKITGNLLTGKYSNLIINGVNFDISNISLKTTVSGAVPFVSLDIFMGYSSTVSVGDFFIDQIMVTTDEF